MSTGFVVIPTPYEWITHVVLGPSPLAADDLGILVDNCLAYAAQMPSPNGARLLAWWAGRVKEHGGIPPLSRGWQYELAAIAKEMFLRERVGDSHIIRYRYAGHTAEERYGDTVTSKDTTEFGGIPPEEAWKSLRLLFEDGHFFISALNYSQVGRGFIHAHAIELPLMDTKDGTIRFSIGVMDYD